MRVKRMPQVQFQEVMKREWVPVQLTGAAIPEFLHGLPNELLHSVYASGIHYSGLANANTLIPSGVLIGGIDVYRNAPDDPADLNKDWYRVIVMPEDDSMFLVTGPHKDQEHWLDEIPERLKGVEILGVPMPVNIKE